MEYGTEQDEVYTGYVAIKWVGYDGGTHTRIVPENWKAEYLHITRGMTPNHDSISNWDVF